VTAQRWDRLAAELAAGLARAATYCEIGRDLLGATGAGVSLVATVERPQFCVTDALAAMLEDLQFTAGEGPSADANTTGRAVVAADLAGGADAARWPVFAPAAAEAGIRAVYAVPLLIGAARLGVLTLYATVPGAPLAETYADALVLGALLTREIVHTQATAPGGLAAPLAAAGGNRAQVHQASGMLSEQLGISVLDALVRLRAYAYATDRPVDEIAADVVARLLRLDS
jgi:hypothetical protein